MKRNILGTAVACLLVSSCATQTPSGVIAAADKTRSAEQDSQADQANHANFANESVRGASEGRLAGMVAVALERDQRGQTRTLASERTDLMQKMQEMGSELAELRGRLKSEKTPAGDVAATRSSAVNAAVAAAIAGSPASTPGARQPAFVRVGRNIPVSIKVAARTPILIATSRVNRETIVIQDKGMIFRVMHGYGRTEFHPSVSLQQQLLQAARAGKHIEIRGRTDANLANDADRNIAMQRALNARVFLANNGIHPRKMHIDYLAAGDNVADNRTVDGRARNRRVEIETAGISADVLEDMASIIRQDLQ